MAKMKVWVVIAAVFLAGFASGAVTVRALTRRFVAKAIQDPVRMLAVIERRMNNHLHLDADQQKKAHEILTRHQADIQQLREDFTPRFSAIMSNVNSEISTLLTPEQKEKFDRFKLENRQILRVRN